MTKRDFIARVLLIMNEARMEDNDNNMYIGSDKAQVDRYIEGSYVDAWRRCALAMPRTWLENRPIPLTGTVHYFSNKGCGFVELPDDFYLLAKFKLRPWLKAVYEAYLEDDRVMNIQSNEYTRGSTIRPSCVIGKQHVNSIMKDVLWFYSLPNGIYSNAEIESALYVPVCTPLKDIQDNYELNIDERVIEPLCYLSASTVLTLFEKYDLSKAIEAKAVEMFPALRTARGRNVSFRQ